ncbi:MAG: glycoside hydrolase family 3 C-terminal domain-containing protein [Caldilinea sp.]|nr:glycoside hydrolase family 3 C-terminal domain-containing protein [Caldilinea sp.]MDW8440993.1 glycoside hydrolase family 3 N-terminal domain-containing protein [Caldilineaceae bacterium]
MKYKDPSLAIEQRVEDLLSRMTLEEKVAQLCGLMPMAFWGPQGVNQAKMQATLPHGIGQISGIGMMGGAQIRRTVEGLNQIQHYLVEQTRLGIPAIFHNEALNGLVAPQAINFPTAIGLSATWEPELVEQMADVIRRQMVAAGMRQALSPVMDVARDPRWGRVHETYGEDPYLCGAMSIAFVRGLQGRDWREGVIATGKHFLGYGLSEGGLNCAATHLGERELYECFARPFEAAIREAGLASIMNSYSEINGLPCVASKEVLTHLLRGKMGFEGFVVSDYFAVRRLLTQFHVAADLEEAAIQALEAGLDVELPNPEAYPKLVEAARAGRVDMALIDQAVRRTLTWKFRLGLFEQPYAQVDEVTTLFSDPEPRRLSRELAAKSLVLLKNDGLLPLRKDLKRVAVIGPHADSVRAFFGWYTFPPILELMREIMRNPETAAALGLPSDDVQHVQPNEAEAIREAIAEVLEAEDLETVIKAMYPAVSVREAIQQLLSPDVEVVYAQGCDLTDPATEGFAAAVEAVKDADVAIVVLGDRSSMLNGTTGEGKDRASLALPGVQQQLLEAVWATGTPTALVLINGRPPAVNWAAEHVSAILEAWYPGQEGGPAIVAALWGEINPGGKLPVTIPRSEGQIPIYHYHKMGSGYQRPEENTLSQYTDIPITPLYAFGHGLSYTRFEYGNLRIHPAQVDSRGQVEIACDVTNVGERAGDEVVQLYLRDRLARVTRPVQELVGFKRIGLAPGERCTVTFTVEMRQLGFYNHEMRFVVEPGYVDVMVGGGSDDIRLRGEFEITGEVVEVMGERAFTSRAQVERSVMEQARSG